MTLRRYLETLRRRWRIMAAVTVLILAVGAVLTALASPTYVASSTNFVSTTSAAKEGNQLYSNSEYTLNQVASYTAIVHSPEVLQPVVSGLGLDMTPNQLAKTITVTNPTGTALLIVQAKSPSAAQAAKVANAVAVRLGSEIEDLESPRGSGGSPVKVTQAVPATEPAAPVSPKRALNLSLALLVGLCFGAAIALLRDQLDTTTKNASDLARSGVALLGTVHFDASLRQRPLAALTGPPPIKEDFRTIRTNLRFADIDSPTRQYVVTSAVADEGKSLTACNIAITLAQNDLKVCLVEGDLRRPKASRYLGVDGSIGVTDVVAGEYELQDALVSWRHGLLSFLPAGTTPPDPIRLLSSAAMADLLSVLRHQYDVVVIDAPPVLPVSDASVLAGLSDGVILVARHHGVRREQLAAAVATIRSTGTTLIGSVLSRVPARERKRAFSGHYYYAQPPQSNESAARAVTTPLKEHAGAHATAITISGAGTA